MGNSLGCIKEPKEKAAGMAPLPPKKRARFKRRRRGKKRAVPAVAPQEELPAAAVPRVDEDPKLEAAPQHEEPDGSRTGGDPDPGRIVQVKERFQGELQKAQLVPEPRGAQTAGDSPEEGTTVIARLMDNPAEQGCERAVSCLVRLQRSGTGSTRAVLLPLPQSHDGLWKHQSEGSPASPVCGEQPVRSWEPADSSTMGMWGRGGSGEPSSSAAWTSTAEPGTVSELSTPSPMVEQMENPGAGKSLVLPSPGAGQGHAHGLPMSHSGSSGGTACCSSGYSSEWAGSTGAAGTAASPAEGARSAQRRALLGSSRPDRGTISDIYISGESGDMSAKEKLLLWTQKVTAGYIGVKCTNFSSCWSDGKMFNALIHRYRPDLVDMERVQIQSNRENLEQAFEIAERLGVTRLLDAEDVDVPSPDEKSVITYVSSIYDAFPKVPEGGEGISAIEVDSRWLEYQTRLESLISWIKQHTILMSDKSFPQNPVELKALYNQYIHFKETEIPAREQEKGRIEELYKLLEVWIEFGRIKLPQGYHPNDVEEEWGKLIIEMLEREKLLRPAVERLELLLQIANKIQNGALSCEEKLTLAKNTLQADAAHLEAGQSVQYEADVVVYLQECEGLIRQLQVDVQILRDENYYQLEELAFRIMRLQDELVTLRLECTNLYRKGHFSTLELVPAPTLSTTQLKGESLTKGLHTSSASWFRKPMTRTELVAISSSEDEGSLRFVYELLAWVEEMQMRLERAEWGSDLPSVETQLETQRHIHSSVEELGSSVKEARLYEGKMSQNFRASYTETLGKLETQYCKLLETSSFRLRHLQSLHGFVSRATAELIWLNEKEEEELAYDWSDNNPNIAAKRNYFSELTMELEEKQDIFRSLQDTAELLALENHPAKQTVEAYSAAVQSQWQWIKQLCLCVEQHVKENAAYFQFFSDARESETYLRNLQDSIRRKYSCDHSTSLTRLEDLLQDSMAQDEKEQLIQSKSSVASLVGRSKSIVQLKPRNPEHLVKSTIPIKAVCDYRQIEITICRNDECVLEDNSQRTKWKVISPTGNEAMVPSVCFLIPPPNKEAIEMANRVEQLYQKVMALWHQLHMNTKSLISWNYLRKDIALVQSFSMEKLRSLAQGECQQALRSLQAHYEDFLQDSRDSELFSVSDRLRLEEEVESSKEHIQQLLESMENEDKDETVARTYLSELQNIRLRLEECEQRLVSRIQSPSSTRADGDSIQENTIRIAEQERTQEDLQQLKSDLRCVSERCYSFLSRAPGGPSTPRLRSELDLVVNKMEQTYGLSSVYLDKLKTVDIIIRNTQGAESLVKGYEVKLSQEEAVPADLTAIQAHRSALQQWLGEVKGKNSVFSVLEEEIAKAKAVGEQLYQLRQERSIDLERYQEKGSQLWDRWQRACAQIETRHTELESIQEVLSDYRQCHRALIQWIEDITAQQELMKPGQAEDSRVLSEQLSQQTALAAEIEKNQAKLDQCQKFSLQYSAAVKDYELQLMTYRAFVESQQKSPMKRRRMLSSSDAITQEFMDLRTRYTALVTLTTQHVKYISDALRRLEEEEKVVEEEKQEHVDKVKELLGWAVGLKQSVQGRTAAAQSRELGDIEKSISEQQALNEELAAKKEQVSEAIKTSQIFLAKHNHKLSHQEKDQISAQVAALKDTYQALCTDTTEQLQQLQSQLAQETEHKANEAVAGVIDLGTVEIFPVFGAMQRGLIDQETGLVLLEAQVITSDLVLPETGEKFSLEEGLARNIINLRTFHVLQELKDALQQVHEVRREGRQLLPAAAAIEEGRISESTGLKILEVELVTGGFKTFQGRISMEKAMQERLLPPQLYARLLSHLESNRDLIDPNTAEKINLSELMQRCILHQDTGLKLLPVKQLAGGMVSLKSGRKVSIFRAVQEGLIDRQVMVRLLEAQLFAGGIVDPRTGHRLAVDEAMRHNLIDQDLACTLLIRQLQTGGIIDTVTGERLTIDEAVRKELVAPRVALVILESLQSFMGFLWPETGEVVPAADALEQGILSTELAYKILSKRQLIKAVFIPETTEVLSWKKAVEHGILARDVVKKLKSMVIPDVMGSLQLAHALSRSSSGGSPAGQQGQKDPELRSDDERLMFHLMTHSYINIHDGQKLLLVDGELSNLTKDLIQTQENGSCAQPLEETESFGEKEAAALERAPCNGVAVQQLELQLAPPQEGSKKVLPPRSALENGEVVMGPGRLWLDNAGDVLHVEEQGQVCAERATTQSETDTESGREQMASASKEELQVQLSVPGRPCDSGSGSRETEETITEAEESKPTATDGVEDIKGQKRALETAAGVVKSESHLVVRIGESRERLEAVSGRSGGAEEPELEREGVGEIELMNEETAQNGTLGGEEAALTGTAEWEQMECTENTESVLHVEEGLREEVLGAQSAGGAALPQPPGRGEEDVLETLQMQLQSGGILCEQMGRTLLLNEAVSCGAVPGHTAVRLMEKMEMFSGFFDSHTREALTTKDVIEEGLMDEKLLQKVLVSDKAISGVLDPGNNFVYSIKDAAAVGLLDKETAMRLLEGQVVTGGVVDLKRGKKVSVTLASNLGLIEPTSQKELVKLEKASKGKSTNEVTRQKLLSLQAETSGIVDPKTKQPLTVAQSVERGLLEREKAFQLLTRQIAGGGILHHASGMRLSVSDAMKHDLISGDLYDDLMKAEAVCLQECTHPETKEKLPLPQAVAAGIVSPEFQRKVQEIQAGAGSVIDPTTGQRMALSRAVQDGLLPREVVEKALSSPELKHGIVDPESCLVVPYAEMVKKCRIDVESGQRYLEVHPFRAMRDEASGRALTCAEALRMGRADPLPTLRLLQGQADSGGFVQGAVSSRLSLQDALQRGMLDEGMATVIGSRQLRAGGIVDAGSGKRLALEEAVEKGLIGQRLAAALQEAQMSVENGGSEVLTVDKPQLSQEKMEKASPKEEGVVLPSGAAVSDDTEHKARSKAVSSPAKGERPKLIPLEAAEEGAKEQREMGKMVPGSSALSAASLSVDVVMKATEMEITESSSFVRKGAGGEAAELGTVEVVGVEEELCSAEDSKERRRGLVSMDGALAEGAAVASERRERVGSWEQGAQVMPRESVGLGKEELGSAEPRETREADVPVKPARDKPAGRTVGETARPEAEGPGDQEGTGEIELKPAQKQKSRKRRTKQVGASGDITQLEKPVEKQSRPIPISKEIPGKEEEVDFVSRAPEPKPEAATKELPAGWAEDASEQKQMESSRDGKAKSIPGKEGPHSSASLKVEGILDQEEAELETTSDAFAAVSLKPDELIIREEPAEGQDTCAPPLQQQAAAISIVQAVPAAPVPQGDAAHEEAAQEKPRQGGAGDRGLLLPVIVEGEMLETSSDSARPAQIRFSKKMCLEHDEKLISYLSMLRDIEMRIKRVQPAEQNLDVLQTLLQQAEALGAELRELSFPVNQELDAVKRIVASPPEEVPEQLLTALEKDAKNLQRSLSSTSDILESRLQNLRGAAESQKAEITAQHETLQGKLQELLCWVSGTAQALDSSDYQHTADVGSLSRCLQRYQELSEPLADTKSQLDATAFDIQFLISEHAQDLSPQQSRQLLRLLNELQKSFRELEGRVTAQVEVLQVCLQQAEQTDQVKTLQEQQAARAQNLAELSSWLAAAEDTLVEQQRAASQGDLPALQQRQSDVKELQRNMHSRAASFANVLKSTEEFLEENKAKMEPGELAVLQEKLQRAKEQYHSLQERTEMAQKELESAVTAAVQQETKKVKAAKELQENSNKIDTLLSWVASLEQKGELPQYRLHPAERAGKGAGDIPDGRVVGAGSTAESLDEQFEGLKAQHQELLSQQQDVILATQAAQAFLDKHGQSLPEEERARLQGGLAELKERYAASLARSEVQLKQVQVLRDEMQKFLRDHGEFEAWLQQAEQDLEGMCKGDSDPESIRQLLLRQGSFSEDVISHKGDLRFITMSGQKVLDAEGAAGDAGSSGSVVKSKLEDASQRYGTLHCKCTKLGSHLSTLLDHYQQFQEVAESLQTWLEDSEAAVGKLLSESVSSDPKALQEQLASTGQLQGNLAEHQVPVEKLQKAARSLLEVQGEPAPDHRHIQETTDAIVSRFQSLSQQMAERSDLLQKSIAQSQSVQESLENLLHSVADIERSLSTEQPGALSSAAIQDSLASSAKLKQDIARQRSCLEATREMVTRFAETADGSTAAALQGKLEEAAERFGRLCQQQQEKEEVLKGLLPKVEQYEQLSEKLQQFTESRARMLASGNQPERDIARFSQHLQELNVELGQHQEDLAALEQLAVELGANGFVPGAATQQEKLQNLKEEFLQLQKVAKEREREASSCQEQLDEFRRLVAALRRWLKDSEGKVPPVDTSLGTQELQRRRQRVQELLEEWSGKGPQVEELSHRGTLLENLIVEITAPDSQTKAGSVLPAVGGPLGSVNGFHTCKDLTEIQCDVSDVSRQYEGLGTELQERLQQLSAMLERMQEVQEEAGAVLQWLESKERTLSELEASSSPTKTETMRAQAEHNKAFLAELEQNSGKIQKVKEALSGLLEKYPDSPEAANWKKMQDDLNCRWERASQATAERQQKLEESANQLASFQAAEAQLRPWLMEKELMMSVLGPLSIDPNMLNAQKQQVQFMLKEFEARRQQHEQLNQAAQSILTGPGDVSPSTNQVREELQGVNQKWSELTERLNSRSSQIDQAIVKSTQYQELLQGLSEKVKAVGQRLSSQSAVSTQPDAVKQQLEETSEIRSDLEQLEEEIAEAQTLCDDLSVLIGEQYLKDELRKRLETVALPLKGLEDLAADRMNRLQTALASSQQFQHMFDELRTWLDDKLCQQARSQPISAKLERLQSQIQEQEEFQKSLNQHSGSYEMIVAEGESLLLSVQPGEEKTTLQNQLVSLKMHWEELSKQAADRHSRLKDCLQKAHKYQRHTEDLWPWVEDCKAKMSELEVTLDPVQLEATLLRSRALLGDVEKRRSVLEMLNSAADVLIDASQCDEDDIRDEKASINQEMDAITEELQAKTGSIDEMSQRLKEFQESFKNIEKKLEGAKHQLEIFEALGPQACSNKNLEKLRAQQEVLQALEPQVDYLKHFTRGLVEDAPDGSDCSQLLGQADVAQEEFRAVRQKVNDCCVLMENKLEGIGQFTGRVREMFSQLADLDDELDGMGPTGRDTDSLQSQAEDIRSFLSKLQGLKADIEASESECKKMLEDEGSPDLLGLKRELETLSKQCSKLTERGRSRQEQVETTLARVEDFYSRLKELTHMTTAAEESEALQWVVGTEVETINQQLADFKLFQKEQVDPLQLKLQQVNGVGQGLIQSAGKNCDVQGLEHDMEEINTRWNTLNKKVAQRIAQLQEALLRCGKFQDALEPLLSWLTDTEELISNQKPPSAEYKVVKAQIQEQKLLQRLLDDRKATVEMIQAEGGRIAQSAEPADREKITGQLQSLESRWAALLCRAAGRQKQLEDILVLAKQFHETTEPVSDWLSVTEKKLANSEPIGTQTAKIQQQISRHKALNEEIVNRKKNVDQAIRNGQALLKQTTGEEVLLIQEKLDGIKTRYSDITAASSKALRTLEQARQLATKFQSTHEELNAWMSKVEDELASSGGQSPASEQIPQFQQRQKELKKEVMEQRLVLDTVNEVSRALLELVPWRAREGLDKLVSDTNERYKLVSDTVRQRVEEIDAAIQRSQQYEQAADAELAWVAETKRKLMALGAIRLEQDQTTAQLQVQKAFSIDIIRHKDSMDELFSQRNEIFGTCGEEQKAVLQEKTESLVQQYEAVSQLNSERYARLERAQVLVNQFWETYEELSPWIEETQALISQLPPPAIDHEQLKQQQEDMRQLRESIAEHKPHIDKLLKIGPQLKDLNPEEGEMVQKKYSTAEAMYAKIKEEVCQRALALDEAVSQSTQFHDKIEPMLETLEALSSRLRMPPLIPAEVDKIRECISENKNATVELEKLQPSFEALKRRGEELVGRSQGADKDLAAKVIQDKLDQMVFFWEDIKARAEEREMKFLDVLELAEKFWYDMAALLTTIKDTQDIVHDLESPGIDPSIIKQQVEAAETIKEETDGLHEELEFIRLLGTDLIFACGETEKPEVKKSIDEMNNAWENLNKTWKERLEKLEEAMQAAVQYQDTLQAMFDWLDNAVIKLCNMSPVGTDLNTVKEQMNEMKEFKMEVYQQQIEMEKLNHQGELMLKKATDETDRDIIKEPLTELKHLWENLGEKIAHRQHKLEAALLALGQFQHALAELMAWLTHTEELLDAQKPINGDPKVIEVELAKHHVLKNDVLAHQATVETVNRAGNELLESSAGDDASSLRNRLEGLNACWEAVLQKTEEREQQLQSTLQQAQGFHGEIEDFLLWLTRMESQLSASKPTGGLPETAREQLNAHMELYGQLKAQEDVYSQLLAKGRLMLLNRDDSGSGSKTEQSVALLEQKWCLVSTKMEERKAKLEEALALATDFQNSLQDFINWLTLAEQSLNIVPPPSLILNAVMAQIDEHKVFANEVNAHRDRIIELDQTGNQLKFLSQKQDVVLIKNLLVSVQSRWEKVVQRSVERGRALDDARKRAKQFHEAWKKLIDWLEDAENHLDSELEISNDPDKIKLQLSKHKEFQKTLGGKQPVYDTTIRTGRALKEKALLPDDTQKLDNLLGEVRDKWDTVCGKSVERQHKLEEALLFSGQFMDALQALVDWLYKVEPQLAEDQPVHGDLDLVMNLMDAHKVFQKELGKRTGTVQVLKRSGRELIESSRDDTTWVKVQLQELSNRWDTVCKLSVSKQSRLEQALKQAEEFRTAVHMLLEWLSEAEQSLRFRGALPDDAEALQSLIDVHKEFMKKVEEKRVDVNAAVGMGEVILSACHPDCITTIKHWITIIRARFEEVLTWARQHQQRLEAALSELVANAELLEELLAWIQWAETTLIQRDQEPMPQNIDQVKALITEHQSFMEEMTRKQPDVDRVTKTYKRKATEPPHGALIDKSRSNRKSLTQAGPPTMPIISQSETKNPRINQLSARWQQVWLLALERQRKLNDALDRLEELCPELKEFANFDFDVWRKKYMRWMNHKKSRVMDFFRRIDKDQDGKITRQEFIDGILASKFPTTKLEMTAVADIFDRDGDGYIDYYEFVAALHPNKDAYRPTTDADKIEDEVTRQVAQCKCAKRFQVEQIGENKYRFFLGNQFGDSQQLRLVRILRSTVMVRVGGGWMALDEFLVKNDPCRARGRTNLELREKFILPEGASQGMTPFRSRGRRSKPSSRAASPTRSSSSASQSNHSCASMPSSPATPASGAKVTPAAGSKLKRPTFHSSRTSLVGDTSNSSSPVSSGAKSGRADPKKAASRPTSRAGSRTGSRASSRRGSDASDFDLLETQSACSDTSESSVAGSRRGAKPSKIPTMSKKTSTATPKTPGPKR
ncbi:microtubule-actin cross-linking factor 1 isoform X19 [Coturnix japonica]|uniref:microtubule-actin cross-linking factor 1 isoform X19 n=1 Tax=Coturnix japonica TaxID=93934 RepID=UPI0007770FDA|nr:microtubule-actin cross-linking factor 1 isoform X19 [Coturnix japonica]